ncbi:acyl carrier protein [Mesorhizobium sp. M0761]|uniref:acyl carrier protein n=1 Tax=unclassified Mesorhizobium TaxID=325217 RepID=UPI0003CED131|nr:MULTISPECIES: acyl carrier protein [unclassified Mesorhizobium]ESX18292.1 hypothetical protein X766_14655 [Mesorhizobium sp. LSJC255A00]ESX21051.1 hypothetical protein X765_31590 [Mesorhizobium sp. LSHC440B00]ESX30047.1 hypothetical protein X764_31280 [Mesorhizobium sp. LSHC440A00]ESX31070.1 hypothetical protein X763_27435 [Mesorhizobium sp. LSHC432A00]ESX68360.1 hypothetical protein X757_28235 [Mesorhizobium sp. LSHC414A00]
MDVRTRFKPDVGFPDEDVEDRIREAVRDQMGIQSVLRPRTRSACEPEIDSLVVIEIICSIEEVLGIKLPTTFAPKGGYDSVEACVGDLVAETRAVWNASVREEEHHDR